MIAQLVNCLPCKYKDNFIPESMLKSETVQCGRGSLWPPAWGVSDKLDAMGQPSLLGEVRVRESPCLRKIVGDT